MKKVLILIPFFVLIACKKNKVESDNNLDATALDLNRALYGNWVGEFNASVYDTTGNFVYSNKINIIIKKIEKNTAYGQSIVAGNSRPLLGSFKKIDDRHFKFTFKEPGNKDSDGKFEFTIKNDVLEGTWFAYNHTQHVTQRTFKLKKQEFKYNPNAILPNEGDYIDFYSKKTDTINSDLTDSLEVAEDYYMDTYRSASDIITKINSSTQKLTENDLKNLKKLELEILRNTIYARHGYTFKKKSFRQFFDFVDWYVPISENVDNELTSIEKQNIKILNRFEKYAEDNYDSFGR